MKEDFEYERDYNTDLKKVLLLFCDYTEASTAAEKDGFLMALDHFIGVLDDPIASAVFPKLVQAQGDPETLELYTQILQEHLFELEREIA